MSERLTNLPVDSVLSQWGLRTIKKVNVTRKCQLAQSLLLTPQNKYSAVTKGSFIRIPMTYPLINYLVLKCVNTYKSKDDPWLHEP